MSTSAQPRSSLRIHRLVRLPLTVLLVTAMVAVLAWVPASPAASTPTALATTAMGTVTNYANPGISAPWSIVEGPDGNIWYANSQSRSIGKINPDGVATSYTAAEMYTPLGITVGPAGDDDLWFTNWRAGSGYIGRITTAGVITLYSTANPVGGTPLVLEPRSIALGSDDALWYTNGGGNPSIGRFDPTTETFSSFPTLSTPFEITRGPGDTMWYTSWENGSPVVGRISTAAATRGAVTEYTVPTIGDPQFIVAGLDGTLWFTMVGAGDIWSVTTGGTFTRHAVKPDTAVSGLQGITVAPDGAIWFTDTEHSVGRIATNGALTLWNDLPVSATGIAAGPSGTFWLTNTGANTISRLTPDANPSSAPTIATFYGVGIDFVTLDDYTDPVLASSITGGPDGNVWFTSRESNTIGRVTPGGWVTSYYAPGLIQHPYDIVSDGTSLWFTNEIPGSTDWNAGWIARITTAGVITKFVADGVIREPTSIAFGSDGNLWFTDSHIGSGTINRMTREGTILARYDADTGYDVGGASKIITGPDGALWYVRGGNNVGRITTDGLNKHWYLASAFPRDLAVGPDGNIWMTSMAGNVIMRLDPAVASRDSGSAVSFQTDFTATGIDASRGIAAGPDGALWFTNEGYNTVGRITTDGTISTYTGPGISVPWAIALGSDGGLWFTNTGNNTIGRVQAGAIVPVATTLSAVSGSGTYGGTGTLTATLAHGGTPVEGQSVAFTLNSTSVGSATTNASGVATLTGLSLSGIGAGSHAGYVSASFAGSEGYAASGPTTGDLAVAQASLTISANNKEITWGQATPTFDVGYATFVGGDSASSLGGSLVTEFEGIYPTTYEKSTVAPTAPGAYSIIPSGLTSTNYAISFVPGTYAINATANHPTTISWYNAGITPSTGHVGEQVTFSAILDHTDLAAATLTARVRQFDSGTCTITSGYIERASGTVGTNGVTNLTWTPASTVSAWYQVFFDGGYIGGVYYAPSKTACKALTVNPALVDQPTLSITSPEGGTYGQSLPITTSGGSGTGTVTFNAGSSTACEIDGGNVKITKGTGTCSITATKAGDATHNPTTSAAWTITVDKAALTATADDATISYGDSSPGFGVTFEGFVFSGDNFTKVDGTAHFTFEGISPTVYPSSSTEPTGIGVYRVTPNGLTSDYYAITFVDGTYTINPTATHSVVLTWSDPAISPSPAHVGEQVTFAASADHPEAALAVSVRAYPETNCASSGGLSIVATGTVGAGGVVSLTWTPAAVSTAWYVIHFDGGFIGGVQYLPAETSCRSLTVGPALLDQAALSVTGPSSGTYGESIAITTSGGSGSGDVTFSAGTSDACSIDGSNVKITAGSGTCSIIAEKAADATYEKATSDAWTITVSPKALSITAVDKTITYGDAPPTFTVAYDGFITGEDEGDLDGTLAFGFRPVISSGISPASVGVPTGGGSYWITPSGLSSTNYAITFVDGTFLINPANPDLAIHLEPDVSATYGDEDFSIADHVTSSGDGAIHFELASDSVGCSVSDLGLVSITAAALDPGHCIISVHQDETANFLSDGPHSDQFNIAKRVQPTLTITSPTSATFGAGDVAIATTGGSGSGDLTFDATGSTACSIVDGKLHVTTGTGTCSITASKAGDANNLEINSSAHSVTINKAGQSISFAALPSRTWGDPDFNVSATAGSGLPVSFGASGACSITGTLVHITGTGTCTITASQGGNDDWSAATSVPRSFSILAAIGTVAYNGQTLAVTSSAKTTTAQVRLSASVVGSAGSIAGAKVTFIDDLSGAILARGVVVSPVAGASVPTGTAVATVSLSAGKYGAQSYMIRVVLDTAAGSTYRNDEQLADPGSAAYATISVLTPGGTNTAKGDADIATTTAAGLYAGATGVEYTIGFQYNNRGTNPQGQALLEFELDGYRYYVKSNSISSLVCSTVLTRTASTCRDLTVYTKASIYRVNGSGVTSSIDGNVTLRIDMHDAGGTATGDTIAFTVLSSKTGALYWSSSWAYDTASKSWRTVPVPVSATGGIAVQVNY